MEIKGTETLLKKLKSLDGAVQGKILRKAVARGCKTVQAEAKLLCPVDKGELRNSIMTKVEENSKGFVGKIYTNKEYAPYVEFGTGQRGMASSGEISVEYNADWKGQPAHYFI